MEQAEGAKPLLDVQGLNIAFAKGKKLIRRTEDVHFQVYPGEIVSIVGESGCGKSVTSLSVMQLVQAPQGQIVEGSIRFRTSDIVLDKSGKPIPVYETEIGEDGSPDKFEDMDYPVTREK